MDNFGATRNTETAIIPKGTVINGNIAIEGKLEMYGVVNGDINSDNRVNISGDVTGNIKANDLYAKDSFIVGQIVRAGSDDSREHGNTRRYHGREPCGGRCSTGKD